MKYKKSVIFPIVLTIFGCSTIYAAQNLIIDHPANVPSAYEFNTVAKLNQHYNFKLAASVSLGKGKSKLKFNQYYLGVPIWGVSLSATQEGSGYSQMFGNAVSQLENDLTSVKPSISVTEAMTIAKKEAKISSQEKSVITNEENQLYIFLDQDKKAHLAYFISFMQDGENPTRPHFLIDAHSGKVLEQWEGLTTKDAIGPGGNQKTGQYNYGTDYGYLIVTDTCQMDSPNVVTWDMKNLTSGGAVHQFDCSGNPPINTYRLANGAFSPINDAHYFGNVVFNMYKTWFNQSPLTMKLKMRVHYGLNYQNAFWDGQQMTFGDGASTFYPFTALDVVGHEVSHGFTSQHSNLTYSKQSGGINEAFSDMAGEAVEYFNNAGKPVKNDWLVGATIMKTGTALRYFSDPTKDGRSIGNAKDYFDGLDVHYSSGVFNKAFYTLANTSGWNTEKAFRPFVLANQVYWNQSTNFDQGGCGVMKAAQDLGFSTTDVINAFNVVGVNANCGTTPTTGTLQVVVAGDAQCPIPAAQQFKVTYTGATSNTLTVTGTTPVTATLTAGAYSIAVTPDTLPSNSNCKASYAKSVTVVEKQTVQEKITYTGGTVADCTIQSSCFVWGTPGDTKAGSSCNFSFTQPTTLTNPTYFSMSGTGITAFQALWNVFGNATSGGNINLQLQDATFTTTFGFVGKGIITLPATVSVNTGGKFITCKILK